MSGIKRLKRQRNLFILLIVTCCITTLITAPNVLSIISCFFAVAPTLAVFPIDDDIEGLDRQLNKETKEYIKKVKQLRRMQDERA